MQVIVPFFQSEEFSKEKQTDSGGQSPSGIFLFSGKILLLNKQHFVQGCASYGYIDCCRARSQTSFFDKKRIDNALVVQDVQTFSYFPTGNPLFRKNTSKVIHIKNAINRGLLTYTRSYPHYPLVKIGTDVLYSYDKHAKIDRKCCLKIHD
jgi:hypothetical protein